MKNSTVQLCDMQTYFEIDGVGERLLLLHGGGGCHSDWAYTCRDQLLREYTLITLDARGMAAQQIPKERLLIASARMTLWLCWIISESRSVEP